MQTITFELTDEQYASCQAFIKLPVHLTYDWNPELEVNVPKRRWEDVEALFNISFHETLANVLRVCPLPSTKAKIDQVRALEAEIEQSNQAAVQRGPKPK